MGETREERKGREEKKIKRGVKVDFDASKAERSAPGRIAFIALFPLREEIAKIARLLSFLLKKASEFDRLGSTEMEKENRAVQYIQLYKITVLFDGRWEMWKKGREQPRPAIQNVYFVSAVPLANWIYKRRQEETFSRGKAQS